MRTNSARTLSLFIVTVLCHTASAQQLLLQPVFSDDFSEDTRGDYEPQGDILWEAGKLTLSDGASLERTFKGGPWTRMEVEFESGNGTANAESAEVRLWLRLAGAPDCIVCLDQQDKQTERGFDKVALKRASDGSGDAVPRLIRESNLEADVQRLTIDYRHGVARIGSGDSVVLSAYFEDGATAITGLRIEALGSPTRMNALSIMAAPPPPKLTASQKAALEKASALNARMMEFFRSGNFSEAVETAEDVLEITEATVGSQHPDYAVSLNNLAAMLWQAGESVRAESLYEQSLEITRELLGPHHPEYAMGLSNLGGLYGRKGDYERALALVEQSVNIRKAAFGEENDEYAISISNLAMIHSDLGNYNHAAALYRRASDIFKSVLGERHPHYATSLLNLATSMGDLGDHTESRRLLERSLEVRESTLGKEHPAYAASLHNLATHYQMMGEYRTAEPLFQEALRLKLAALGDQHPEYAVSLKKLGRLYNETGDFAQAEMLYRQASKIDVKRFGTEHPTYAAYLNNLALLLKNQGKFDQAEPLYQQASSITRNALGTQHRSYATSLHNLATLYGDMGQLDQAMRLAEESLAIRESVLGEQHPDYALSLQTLGKLHQLRGEYNTARPLHQRAMEIRQAVYGEQHASIADCLKCLAGVFDGTGQHADAEPLHREALALHRRLLNSNAAVQSIRQQIRNQEEGRVYLDARLSNATLMDSTDPAGVAEDLWQWKGAVSMRQRAYRQVTANDEVAPLLADLQSVNRQLSALSTKTPVPPPTSASKTAQTSYTQRRAVWEAGFAELNREREALEKRIASGSDGFRRILQPLLLRESNNSFRLARPSLTSSNTPSRLQTFSSHRKNGPNAASSRLSCGQTGIRPWCGWVPRVNCQPPCVHFVVRLSLCRILRNLARTPSPMRSASPFGCP
jgi:tetratricopeptide (TPR) repeat protein